MKSFSERVSLLKKTCAKYILPDIFEHIESADLPCVGCNDCNCPSLPRPGLTVAWRLPALSSALTPAPGIVRGHRGVSLARQIVIVWPTLMCHSKPSWVVGQNCALHWPDVCRKPHDHPEKSPPLPALNNYTSSRARNPEMRGWLWREREKSLCWCATITSSCSASFFFFLLEKR